MCNVKFYDKRYETVAASAIPTVTRNHNVEQRDSDFS